MFDNIFSPSPAVWTGLIAAAIGLPVLIHLINLMRHKTVKWAAMEFLLRSHRKNRNRVWLKQMLLLLSRIAALMLLLFMLGQAGCNEDRVARLLGGATTHHYVIIDDSYSMSDRGPNGTAMDNARSTLSMIAARARNRQNQIFTIIRSSRSSSPGGSVEASHGTTSPDMNGQLVDSRFDERVESAKSAIKPSNLSGNVDDALQAVVSLINERENANAIVYILSDFRQRDWQNPETTSDLLSDLHDSGAAIELVNCVTSTRQNLAVTELKIDDSVRVPRTPLMMSLTIRNYGDELASNVQIKLKSLTFVDPMRKGDIASLVPEVDELPAVFIERIEAGGAETRSFAVSFSTTGQHVISASLDDDAVNTDNLANVVVPIKAASRVLIIDGPEGSDADFLSLAINPGGLTGLAPEIRTRDFLRDATQERLEIFDVIYLLDVDRLEDSAITNLENYAAGGGGVAFFAGPNVNLSFYNSQLYRNGDGIYPVPLEGRYDVPEVLEDTAPDISANLHPIFPGSVQNPLLDAVQINSILRPGSDWIQNPAHDVQIAATLRNNNEFPLILNSTFGQGTIFTFLTTAGPDWNNWSRNGTYPAVMLLAEDLLARGRYPHRVDVVGVPVEVSAPASAYGPEATFVLPGDDGQLESRVSLSRRMSLDDTSRELYQTVLGNSSGTASSVDEVSRPGIYDIWLQSENLLECQRLALNVDTSESDMAQIEASALLDSLQEASPTFVDWNEFNPEPERSSASTLSRLLLALLLLILICESVLAWSCSYHTNKSSAPEAQTKQNQAGRRRLAA
ncbi:MAG: BatA domain-containing protein [Planctomycetota bacterium]